jgi:hypothetical protein
VNKNESQTLVQPNVIPLLGPALIFLSVLLLVVKQSPFYIDLSVIAFSGVLFSWRWKWKGVFASSALLGLVLGYDFFFEEVAVSWLGFGLSFQHRDGFCDHSSSKPGVFGKTPCLH